MVDSSPKWLPPSSSTSGMRPPSSSITAVAEVAVMLPKRFALGAAIGLSTVLMTALKTRFELIPHCHRGLPGGREAGDEGTLGQDERERPGPELPDEPIHGPLDLLGDLRDLGEKVAPREMDDERVGGGPALGLEDPTERGLRGRISCEPVDGLGGKGHDLLRIKDGDRLLHGMAKVLGRLGGEDLGHTRQVLA